MSSLLDSCLDQVKNSGHVEALKNTTSSDEQLHRVWNTNHGVLSLELVQCKKEDNLILC